MSFELTSEDLHPRTWRLMSADWVVAPFVLLRPSGRLGGHWSADESRWALEAGRLLLIDELGRTSAVLDPVQADEDGRLSFQGPWRGGERTYVLQEIAPLGQLASSSRGPELLTRKPAGTRRNLVVLRANERSLHRDWEQDIAESERNWDLCISYYGSDDTFPPDDFSEYATLQNKERKFEALWLLMHETSPLWRYEYFLFPDDDLMIRWGEINKLFETCLEYGLELAQPSLHPSGVINYFETRQNRNFKLRFVSFVEAMAPLFSRSALKDCAPTFSLNSSGYGIDYGWGRIIGNPATSIAVIDAVTVLHTRATAGNYNLAAYVEEGKRVSQLFGTLGIFEIREFGGVYVQPSRRWPDWR